ncbi:MAG: glycine cleavage system aminomethyltransferase GcvT, partial [Actinomycetota bacterium]
MANDPRRTPLYDRHVELGARMVDFAGWEMPVYYVGINEEHRAVRARAGLFDVSHMGQIEVTGSGAEALLRKALASDIDRLEEGRAQYSFLLNDKGGIVDDLIVYRLPAGRWLLVVNAGNTPTDFAHLKALKQRGAVLRDLSAETAMVALQGPVALELLADIWPKKTPAPETIPVFGCVERVVAGVPCLVARTGYTGEPGVELMCAADRAGD